MVMSSRVLRVLAYSLKLPGIIDLQSISDPEDVMRAALSGPDLFSLSIQDAEYIPVT